MTTPYTESTISVTRGTSQAAALRFVLAPCGDAGPQDLVELVLPVVDKTLVRCLVLWAADCAERVLPLFEARFPDDARPRVAVAAARAAAYAARAAAYAAYAGIKQADLLIQLLSECV